MKKGVRGFFVFLLCILVVVIVQTIPVYVLKPLGAGTIKGINVIVYYQKEDKAGAMEIYELLEGKAGEIREKLEFPRVKETEVYVYAKQPSLHIRKYGLVTLLAAPKWFIGDNRGDKVLIVSPNAEIEVHTRESILSAAVHELVHTMNFQINSEMSYWNDNGVATYLANQAPGKEIVKNMPVPAFQDTKTKDQLKFGNMGGYEFSYTYIEFLDKTYGWNSVIEMLRGSKTYEEIFSRSERDIYNEWVEYLKKSY